MDWAKLLELPRTTDYIPHVPTDKQAAFMWLNCREAFYGGAAGGGKSDALLMGALQYVDIPDYAAILFRRTYADLALPGALMPRAQEWLAGTDAHWNGMNKLWAFPSGATLSFGYLDTENDKFRYQSAEFQYVGFDELTQFSETQYTYLFSRLRRQEGSNIPLRMRAASNPGGVGHDWVKQRFVVEYGGVDRRFVPAMLEDNPYLDIEEYEHALAELDPVTRAQLRHGDWETLPEGQKFKRAWIETVAALRDRALRAMKFVRYWDLAATEPKLGKDPDWTVGLKLGTNGDGVCVVTDVKRERLSPRGVEQLIGETAEEDGRAVEIWMEQEPGSSGLHTIHHYRQLLQGFAFRGHRTTGSKEERANPVSAQAEAGNIKIVRAPWNKALIDELVVFPSPDFHDDQVDALSGAFSRLIGGKQVTGGITYARRR